MKIILAVLVVASCGVWADPQGPYPPSGFRPNGPAFELPQKNTNPQYLPPLDPRRPVNPNFDVGADDEDVSVQGLPAQEPEPIFQGSPINGQQYTGASINTDIRNLDNSDSFRQYQYQLQQEKYRQLERQRQFDATQPKSRGNQLPAPQVPRQFAQNTPSSTESSTARTADEARAETTTELDLNEGESLDESRQDSDKKEKASVEVSKQNLQEYPGELFLSSLAQLQLQPQFVPFQQFDQLRAPLYYQPLQQQGSQKQVAGYDGATHFAALPSVLAQRQIAAAQPQGVVPQGVNPALLVAGQDQNTGFIAPQQFNQYQPVPQPQLGYQPVAEPQAVNQPNQFAQQPEAEDDNSRQQQEQFVYQQSYQPQEIIYQPQAQAPNPYQFQDQQSYFLPQAQLINYPNQIPQQYQNGYAPQQVLSQPAPQVFSSQDSLQSGIDMNQQGNRVEMEDKEDADDDQDDGSTAIAVATAFGARTQPRVYTSYGVPVPSVVANSEPMTETAAQEEQATENPGAVAVANAVATNRRKSAKLRSRRVRPMFTLDRSGHLVLAQEQN